MPLHKPLVVDPEPAVLVRCYGTDIGSGSGGSDSDGIDADDSGSSRRKQKVTSGYLPRITDVVEFIGIYTVDPGLTSFDKQGSSSSSSDSAGAGASGQTDLLRCRPWDDDDDGGVACDHADHDHDVMHEEGDDDDGVWGGMHKQHNPPPSLVPRVQALVVRKLAPSAPALQPSPESKTVSGAFAMQAAGEDDEPNSNSNINSNSAAGSPSRGAALAAAAAAAAASGASGTSGAPPSPSAPAAPAKKDDAVVLREACLSGLNALLSQCGSPSPSVRSGIVAYLTSLLGGDSLAAEYTLLHLISSVFSRAPASGEGLVLGKLSLCLTGFPDASSDPATRALAVATPVRASPEGEGSNSSSGNGAGAGAGAGTGSDQKQQQQPEAPTLPNYSPVLPLEAGASIAGRAVAATIGSLLPRSAIIPLRIDNLNSLSFFPGKGDEEDKLSSGLLQLPAGTHVTVDETVLTSGQLGQLGVKNLEALKAVARSAVLPYAFPYYETSWPADLPVLVLSATKPMIPTDVDIMICCSGPPPVAPPEASDAFLTLSRRYLACVRGLPFILSPQASEAVQSDWMAARRAQADKPATSPGRVKEEDLHRWLTLARLAALSFGETALSPERWAWVKGLEEQRLHRQAITSSSTGAAGARAPGGR